MHFGVSNVKEVWSAEVYNPGISLSSKNTDDGKEKRKNACKLCSASFKTRWGLRKHNAKHTGRYRYVCHLCSKGFMEVSKFNQHTESHRKKRLKRGEISDLSRN